MTRGTTPNFVITVKDFENLSEQLIEVTFKQNDLILVIDKENISITDNKINVFLTQKQTLMFRPGVVKIQVRGINIDGIAWASNVVTTSVKPILHNQEIEYHG